MCCNALERPKIQAVCEYSGATENAEWTFRYAGPRLDLTEKGDQLALSVVKGMTERMEYAWEEQSEMPNCLRLTVRKS